MHGTIKMYGDFDGGGGGQDPNATDPSTLGRNAFGSNYIGPSNPKNFMGKWNYQTSPVNIIDAFAKQHDIAYDSKGVAGAGGLFFSTKTIGADYRLAINAAAISALPMFSFAERVEGASVAIIIGISALPKTILYPIIPHGK